MLQRLAHSLWLAPGLAALLTPGGQAQCLAWDTGFGGVGVGGPVHAVLSFDDGSPGQALYVGGDFDWASGHLAPGVARWDGSGWNPVGAELQGTVLALASYDAGGGPAVFAGGSFSLAGAHMAVWNGAQWVAFAPPSGAQEIVDFAVLDDGGGSVLYAAGNNALGQGAVYAWDGVALTQVGGFPVRVEMLGVHDSGSGPMLYAGVRPMGTTWQIVQWQGGSTWTNWEFVQGGAQTPFELRTLDVGNGPELFVGGEFASIGGFAAPGAASLAGFSWNPLGAGLSGTVRSLAAHDDGSGPQLYAGGTLTASGGTSLQNLARFDGSAWVGAGQADGTVRVLANDVDGNLVAGGDFGHVDGGEVNNLALWDGVDWQPLGVGLGLDAGVRIFQVFDDGSGPALYAGGVFRFSGSQSLGRVARWTGSGWAPLGAGLDGEVHSMGVFDDGTGPALYVGGDFLNAGGLPANRVARWNGATWEALGAGFAQRVNDFAVFDDGSGPAIYAGGEFSGRIARWTGVGWTLLPVFPTQPVNELLAWDDGTGEALYVGGPISKIGALSTTGVARWDGSTWTALGAGLGQNGQDIHDLIVWDDGTGERLFAAGNFTKSGTATVERIARWDGTAWSPVGSSGANSTVRALLGFDDGTGSGSALYAAGDFNSVGGAAASRLARWDGSAWSPVDGGLDDRGFALASFDDGGPAGPSLWIGGDFSIAGTAQASSIARYSNPCPVVGVNYCTAGTSASGCQAIMSASGAPSATAPSGFYFQVNDLEGQKTGLFLWSSNGKQANSWGNGTSYICVVPPRYRSGVLGPSGTLGACDASLSTDMNARWQAKPASNPGAGAVTQAQFWYRDPQSTSNQTSSLSDGLEFTVGP